MTWTFDHLAFNTGDGQTLQDAFGGLLGLTPGRRPPFPFPGVGCIRMGRRWCM